MTLTNDGAVLSTNRLTVLLLQGLISLSSLANLSRSHLGGAQLEELLEAFHGEDRDRQGGALSGTPCRGGFYWFQDVI